MADPARRAFPRGHGSHDEHEPDLLQAAYFGNFDEMTAALSEGVDVNIQDSTTGMTALHLAIARRHARMIYYLINVAKADFMADRFGRWPSLLAAVCDLDDELSDFIVEKEAEAAGITLV